MQKINFRLSKVPVAIDQVRRTVLVVYDITILLKNQQYLLRSTEQFWSNAEINFLWFYD